MGKLFHETSLWNTIRQCRSENKSYHETIEYFNDEALTVHHFDHQLTKTMSRSRHAHMTTTQGEEDFDDFQAFLMPKVPSQFMMPKDLYYCIPENARVEFNQNRQRLVQHQSPTGHAKP